MIIFCNEITKYGNINKMNNYNLAVIFSPSLFRPRSYCAEDLGNARIFVLSLHEIIENYQKIFNQLEIFNLNLNSKIFMSNVNDFVQLFLIQEKKDLKNIDLNKDDFREQNEIIDDKIYEISTNSVKLKTNAIIEKIERSFTSENDQNF